MMGSYNSSNNPLGESSSQCMQCGVNHEDEDLSSATSTDEGEMDTEAQAFAAVTVDGEHRSDQASIAAELYHLYRQAKRRWRRLTGRPPRRFRKFGFKPKNFGKLGRTPYSKTHLCCFSSRVELRRRQGQRCFQGCRW